MKFRDNINNLQKERLYGEERERDPARRSTASFSLSVAKYHYPSLIFRFPACGILNMHIVLLCINYGDIKFRSRGYVHESPIIEMRISRIRGK